jgi:POT family proton-dependent oligopeptide transporter
MWERFSYYGMRALLVPYMLNYFRWAQQSATSTYKIYTSLVYITPILGGYLADRFLGNRLAVIIGGSLMAVGHFLMAFEEYAIFYAALVFLILGNGFFKPNMSTQVGRLYPTNDGRRDAAYTIFYMGINLGAFLSPLACGWLQENTVGGYHSGFTLAGIGMVAGLVIYLLGQPLIKEIPNQEVLPLDKKKELAKKELAVSSIAPLPQVADGITSAPAQPVTDGLTASEVDVQRKDTDPPLTEAQAERTPSSLGFLAAVAPWAIGLLGIALVGGAVALYWGKQLSWFDAFMLGVAGGSAGLMGYVAAQVRGGLRDRILAILMLGVFVIFFWAAFEQAGSVLNLWADKHTGRYLTQPETPGDLVPAAPSEAAPVEAAAATEVPPPSGGLMQRFRDMFHLKSRPQEAWSDWLAKSVNPVPTAWFQSINALAIFVLAPLFAWMWVALDHRGWQPSIPFKMFIGLIFMSAAMAVMMAAAERENRPVSASLAGGLPAPFKVSEGNTVAVEEQGKTTVVHAGRLTFDPTGKALHLQGVLPDNEAYDMIDQTAPKMFRQQVDELVKASEKIDASVPSVEVRLDAVPPGFDMKYAGLKPSVVRYRAGDHVLVAFQHLADKEKKALLVAGGDAAFRETVRELYVKSHMNVVSPWWLVWSYIMATVGELCLSPVGLSMVSKLAPAKFATMLMGVWLLTNAFGNFAAGRLGEIWGTVPPVQFFLMAAAVVGGAALVLLVLVKVIVGTMHGVK